MCVFFGFKLVLYSVRKQILLINEHMEIFNLIVTLHFTCIWKGVFNFQN